MPVCLGLPSKLNSVISTQRMDTSPRLASTSPSGSRKYGYFWAARPSSVIHTIPEPTYYGFHNLTQPNPSRLDVPFSRSSSLCEKTPGPSQRPRKTQVPPSRQSLPVLISFSTMTTPPGLLKAWDCRLPRACPSNENGPEVSDLTVCQISIPPPLVIRP